MVRVVSERAFFDKMADFYDWRSNAPDFDERRARFVEVGRVVRSRLGSANLNCIDLGCGPGAITIPLARSGFKTVGVDSSSEMIVKARLAASEALQDGPDCSFMCADIISFLERSTDTADFVLSSSVFEYLREPQRALSLVIERLKPGGVVAVSIPNRKSLGRLLESLLWSRIPKEMRYTAHWGNDWDAKRLIEEGEAAGLILEHLSFYGTLQVKGRQFLPRYSHYRLVGTMAFVVFAKPGAALA